MISEPMVQLVQTVHLSCTNASPISEWGELSLEPHHLGAPPGASEAISEPMVRLAQNLYLSCTDTYTVSKRKEV